MKHQIFSVIAHLTAITLFLVNYEKGQYSNALAISVPLILIAAVVVNTFWTTPLTSWFIFSVAFFFFAVILSAFTLRWRLEAGFEAAPFYRAMIMYIAFVYISLGQLHKLKKEAS